MKFSPSAFETIEIPVEDCHFAESLTHVSEINNPDEILYVHKGFPLTRIRELAYIQPSNCPIACAIKEKYPNSKVNVTPGRVYIDNITYSCEQSSLDTIIFWKPFTAKLVRKNYYGF